MANTINNDQQLRTTSQALENIFIIYSLTGCFVKTVDNRYVHTSVRKRLWGLAGRTPANDKSDVQAL